MSRANAEVRASSGGHRRGAAPRRPRIAAIVSATITVLVVVAVAAGILATRGSSSPRAQVKGAIPYLGIYEPDSPHTYTGLNQVAKAIGRQPNLAVYYSPWLEPFQEQFASAARERAATALVQISPGDYSLARIASGRYDGYLRGYAGAVKQFGTKVILSFGHEMNGSWYKWGRGHTAAAVFVRAWRHIVTVFRDARATNVTWLWTANIMGTSTPGPRPWWPGDKYVDWVGIDGYYWYKAANFASVFGPTIAYVRGYTHAPILIAETGAAPAVNQPAKIADLFGGVKKLGLLGFVYFNVDTVSAAIAGQHLYWSLTPASLSVLRHDVKVYMKARPDPSLAPASEGD